MVKSRLHYTLLSWPLFQLFLTGCEGGGCGGAAGAADVCPPPVYGYAVVQGHAFLGDGKPIVGKQAYVGCGDVVGAYDDITDSRGYFDVRPVYAVDDTVLYPFPPRHPDGSFDLRCQANLQLDSDRVLRKDPLLVRFAPTRETVVPTMTELREGQP
jgi:hypothetical protein